MWILGAEAEIKIALESVGQILIAYIVILAAQVNGKPWPSLVVASIAIRGEILFDR